MPKFAHGVIPPRMTTAERNTIPGSALLRGMIVYDTSLGSLMINTAADGASAVWIAASGGGVGTLGTRPLATAVAPGTPYFATDEETAYISDGTNWLFVSQVPRVISTAARNALVQATLQRGMLVFDTDLGVLMVNTAADAAAGVWVASAQTTVGTRAARPAANAVYPGSSYFATDENAEYVSDGSAWFFKSQPPLAVNAGTKTNTQTYTLTAPAAGTYIIEWGFGAFNSGAQGNSVSITCSKTSGLSQGADVGGSGGSVTKPGIVCTAGEVITFTVGTGASSNVTDCWAKMTRTA